MKRYLKWGIVGMIVLTVFDYGMIWLTHQPLVIGLAAIPVGFLGGISIHDQWEKVGWIKPET